MKKKLITLALTAIMLLSLMPMTAFAEATEPELAELYGDGFLIFGDSYARGLGGSDDWDPVYYMDNVPGNTVGAKGDKPVTTTVNCRNVPGGYAYLLAQSLGCNTPEDLTDQSGTYWPVAQNGLTLSAVMDLIGYDDGYFDTKYSHGHGFTRDRYDANLYYYGSPDKSVNPAGNGVYTEKGKAGDINEIIGKSKLIAVALGAGDVFNRTADLIGGSQSLSIMGIPALIKEFNDIINEGYKYWEKNYPLFLDYLKANNPNATIAAIGVNNPVFNLTLADATVLPIGDIISALSAKMNAKIKNWAEEKGILYVDITNAEIGITEYEISLLNGFLDDTQYADHPTVKGHQQIARMIIDALKEYNGITEKGARDIVLDIGRFDEIDCVKVNGIPVCKNDYTVKDHVLTVHCKTKIASTLLITTQYNGKIAVSTYRIAYRDGGYTAYRTYTTNNIFKIPDYWLNATRSLFANIFKYVTPQ